MGLFDKLFGKPEQKPTSDTNLNFQSAFTSEQKTAVLAALILLAQCDGPPNDTEMASIEKSMGMLGVILSDSGPPPELPIMVQKGIPYTYNILNTLSRTQKEWFIIAMHTLLHSDGNFSDVEAQMALGSANKIGISADEYKNILDKMDALYNAFLK